MARDDRLLAKGDERDEVEYRSLVKTAIKAKKKIETGFIELAESIVGIHKKKLYKVEYKTFGEFCDEVLGFSRQTIYVYISILKLINAFPEYFPRDVAVEYGHKKMRHITEGANAIDRHIPDESKRLAVKTKMFSLIDPAMPSTEIEAKIEDVVDRI